jgi:hypothetical protein
MRRGVAVSIIVVGAAALVASLWAPWSTSPGSLCDPAACAPGTVFKLDGWQTFDVADVALATLAGLAVGVSVATRGILGAYLLAFLGWLAAAGSLYASGHPSHAAGAGGQSASGIGLFIALAASGVICIGGLAHRDVDPGHVKGAPG